MDVYLGNRTRENLTCGSENERFGFWKWEQLAYPFPGLILKKETIPTS